MKFFSDKYSIKQNKSFVKIPFAFCQTNLATRSLHAIRVSHPWEMHEDVFAVGDANVISAGFAR